jgi:hypothetical protein
MKGHPLAFKHNNFISQPKWVDALVYSYFVPTKNLVLDTKTKWVYEKIHPNIKTMVVQCSRVDTRSTLVYITPNWWKYIYQKQVPLYMNQIVMHELLESRTFANHPFMPIAN